MLRHPRRHTEATAKNLSEKRRACIYMWKLPLLIPFRGQTAWNQSGLSPSRDCSPKEWSGFIFFQSGGGCKIRDYKETRKQKTYFFASRVKQRLRVGAPLSGRRGDAPFRHWREQKTVCPALHFWAVFHRLILNPSVLCVREKSGTYGAACSTPR